MRTWYETYVGKKEKPMFSRDRNCRQKLGASSENRFYFFLDGTRGTLWTAQHEKIRKSIIMIPPSIMVLSHMKL